MKKNFVFIRVRQIFIGCCLTFVLCSLFYFSGLVVKVYVGKAPSLLSFIEQNAHTGLDIPATKIAFNDQNKTGTQFANNSQNKDKQNGGVQTVASASIPRVLFDISVQPILEKNNTVVISLCATVFLLILLLLASSIYKSYKKAKLKKIKGN